MPAAMYDSSIPVLRHMLAALARILDKAADHAEAEKIDPLAPPRFYFHLTTAYDIPRHNGVEIGKGDFMGRS